MIQTYKKKINSARQMLAFGKKISSHLGGGDVILLSGELGAGKTVLCKGIAKGLGVKVPVVSPTFTIMNEYFGRIKFCHFDAYRLENSEEAIGAGLSDFIGNDECLCAVEWWKNIEELFDGINVVHVNIEKTGDGKREVIVSYNRNSHNE